MIIAHKRSKRQEPKSLFERNDSLKNQNIKAAGYMKRLRDASIISDTTYERILHCRGFIRFLRGPEIEAGTGTILKEDKAEVVNASFCGSRFCPFCSKGKAEKDAVYLNALTRYLEDKGYAFIFLTLTIPNVKGDKLKDAIDDMNKRFFSYIHYKQIAMVVKGYVRKLEVTYNKKSDTYHPHFHCLLAVRKSYFSSRDYIKHEDWLALWQKAMKDPSISQVNVKRAGKKGGMEKAILELSKYMAKDSDYLDSWDVYNTFYFALKGKRLIVYGGIFKDAATAYESGALDGYKRQSYMEVHQYVCSDWDEAKGCYNNRIMDINDPRIDINSIRDSLKIRKTELLRFDDGTVITHYGGRTTYGDDEHDENDDS